MSRVEYRGGGEFAVTADAPTEPGPGQVRLAVAYTGICGTDLHIAHGHMDQRVEPGRVIGHEMSGQIVSLGPDVTGWDVGDKVTVMPLAWCGQCPACRAGHTHICHRLTFIGIDSPGSMQSSWTVPADTLVRLPSALSLVEAALVEPTAVAVHDVRRSGLQPGEKAVVVGAGPVGLLIALVARAAGSDVVAVELDPYRRQAAAALGLSTLDPVESDVAEWVREWTGDAGAAVAFEVSGSAAGVGLATNVLAVRGRLVLVGIHSAPREIDLYRFFWRELSLIGARVYQRPDFQEAIQLIADGIIPAASLISRIIPLAQVADAFDALQGGGAVVKLLLDCRGEASDDSDA
jgi:(R,R)-butanediol dehydrogenase / meso-butanediol dehydrogenase / diacetyl reductase